MKKKLSSLLSLCRKAGFLSPGETGCEKALRSHSAKLIIIAENASENTRKKFINKAFYYNTPVIIVGSKDDIARAIGAKTTASVAVTNEGMARKIIAEAGVLYSSALKT
ncbi:MAG: ribosomal L7Ae/L30e/S12e/Gadd45 family protein [Clostridiales bacterium]|jgi:ribosomal protein L7Ae-like RNA K-turn-binding protein|nr:ribosomal L7Ae/L30e/S12e/Gadd45 family protein [Clostridiales bacterium]